MEVLESIGRGMLGIVAFLGVCYLLSSNRKAINWKLVITGVAMQIVFGLLILKVPFIRIIFDFVAKAFVKVLQFTEAGAVFLFGTLITDLEGIGYLFAFQVLPTIIFFSALTAALYYLGILQKVVYVFAWALQKLMNLSGPESLSAAGNIFLGQTEAPLLIRPYLAGMNRSEIMAVMTGGMATIAGGVLSAYIGFLGGDDPERQLLFATHLLSASIMSAPASIVAAKMLIPQTEPVNQELEIKGETIGSNFLEAITLGTVDGLRLAVNVGAMLLVFIAFMAMFNSILEGIGRIGGDNSINAWVVDVSNGRYSGFNLQFILGYALAPFAWLMGVPNQDITLVGQLLGEKTVLNEFVAYTTLGGMMGSTDASATPLLTNDKSIIIATYALCGFANFSSIGIQIGGIGALAPSQRPVLSSLGLTALVGGSVACFLTACVAGMMV